MNKNCLEEARDLAIQYTPDAIKALKQITEDESVDPATRVRAASTLREFLSEANKAWEQRYS